MTYYNYIDHSRYGRIWFSMTLRNCWVLGFSEEQNLERGPCIELTARDYSVIAGGASPEEAVKELHQFLDWYAKDNVNLPENCAPVRSSLRSRLRYWWRMRRMSREGTLCRITKDTGR